MSEEQAIETEDEIIVDETNPPPGEDEIKADGVAEEVEIVVEGEEQPSSKHRSGFQKRIGRLNSKISAANTEAEEANRKSEMLAEENKLLRLQAQQGKPATRPDEDDFETRKEYLSALDDYDQARISVIAQEQAAKIVQASQTQNTQALSEGNLNKQIDKHYERSAGLKVPDYSETEAVAADILGDDISKQIVANTEESHLLMYHLGKNPAKAESLKALIETQPLKGVLEIGRLAGTLRVKPKNSIAPDPETKLEPGGSLPIKKDDGPEGATYV
jgi:hypothetical protein